MSYLALARKWRPQTFADVIGQEHVTRTLTNAILKGKVHHAFLLTGTRGVGKTTVARILAKALCCEAGPGPQPEPCNECSSCREITQGTSVDVHEIDGASNRGIDDVRELQHNVLYQPQRARYRIYIIDEVHMLTKEAFNALLKTLEEPPEHVKFIFATTEADKILPTILSRCQRYDFKMVPARDIAVQLGLKLTAENVPFEDGALRLIARYARGSMRDSQSLLDRVLAYAEGIISEEDVRRVLGVAHRTRLYELTARLIAKDAPGAFSLIDDICSNGADLRQFSGELLEHLRNGVVLSCSPREERLLDLPDGELAELRRQSAQAPLDVWLRWFDILYAAGEAIARSSHDRLLFETTVVKMLYVQPVQPMDELIERVDALVQRAARGASAASRPQPALGRPQPPPGGEPPAVAGRPIQAPVAPTREVVPNPFVAEAAPEPPSRAPRAARREEPAPVSPAPEPAAVAVLHDFADWRQAVNALKRKEASLAGVLREVEFLQWQGGVVRGDPPGPMVVSALGRPDAVERAARLLSEALGESVSLDLRPSTGPGGGPSVRAEEERHEREAQQVKMADAQRHPAVRAILEVFGGGDPVFHPLRDLEEAVPEEVEG